MSAAWDGPALELVQPYCGQCGRRLECPPVTVSGNSILAAGLATGALWRNIADVPVRIECGCGATSMAVFAREQVRAVSA
jgi:hypothetical protein